VFVDVRVIVERGEELEGARAGDLNDPYGAGTSDQFECAVDTWDLVPLYIALDEPRVESRKEGV